MCGPSKIYEKISENIKIPITFMPNLPLLTSWWFILGVLLQLFNKTMTVHIYFHSLSLLLWHMQVYHIHHFCYMSFIYLVCICICVSVGAHMPKCVCGSQRTTCSSLLAPYGPGGQTQVIRLEGRHIYTLSHLTGRTYIIFSVTYVLSA